MRYARFSALVLTALVIAAGAPFVAGQEGGQQAIVPVLPELGRPVDFYQDVMPILETHCLACHQTALSEAQLVLEDYEPIFEGGRSGRPIMPERPDESLLYRLASRSEAPQMPPLPNNAGAEPLSPQELGVIRQWILEGARNADQGPPPPRIGWQPLPAGINPIYAVALSPDGQYAACGRANQIFIYHVPTQQLVTRLTDPAILAMQPPVYTRPGVAHLDLVQSLAFNHDGTLLASGAFREVKLWQQPQNVTLRTLAGATAAVQAVAVTPDGSMTAAGGADNVIRLYDGAGTELRALEGHSGAITELAFSADAAQLFSASEDGTLRVWNVADGAVVAVLPTAAPVRGLAIHPQGTQVATAHPDNLIRLWLPPAPSAVLAQLPVATTAAAVSPDRTRLALGGADGVVRIINVADGTVAQTIEGHAGDVLDVAFSPDGSRLVTGGADGAVRVVELAGGTVEAVLTGSAAGVASVAVHPAAPMRVLAGSSDGTLRLWQAADVPAPRALNGDTGETPRVVAVSPAGNLIAVAGTDRGIPTIVLFDVASGNVARTLQGHANTITALAFSADGSRLASGSADNTARVWNTADGAQIAVVEGNVAAVNAVAFNSDGQQLVTGAADNTVRLWNVADGAELRAFAGHTGPVVGVAMTPNNAQVLSASADGTLRFFNAGNANQDRSIDLGTPAVRMATSRDGARVAVAGQDNSTRLYNIADGALVATLAAHADAVHSVAFSADSTRVLTGSADGRLIVSSAATGAMLESLSGGESPLTAAAYGPAANVVLAANEDRSLRLITLHVVRDYAGHAGEVSDLLFLGDGSQFFSGCADGQVRRIATLEGTQAFAANHGAAVHAIVLRPDQQVVASAGEDNNVRLWNAGDGQPAANVPNGGLLAGHAAPVRSLEFTAGGRLISGSADGSIRVWAADSGAFVEGLVGHPGAVHALASAGETGQTVISAGDDPGVRRWQLHFVRAIPGHGGPVNDLAYAPDGASIWSGSDDQTIRRWGVDQGNQIAQLGHGGTVLAIAVSPDNQRVASAGGNNLVRLWNAGNNQQIAEMAGHAGPVLALRFSADGQLLVSGAADNTLRVWSGTTGAAAQTFSGHAGAVGAAVFATDAEGRALVVSGSADMSVRVWDRNPPWNLVGVLGPSSGEPLNVASSVFIDRVTSLDFSADGALLATGGGEPSRSGEITLWNVAQQQIVLELPEAHTDTVYGIDFSPDGTRLASCSADRFVKVFALPGGEMLKSFEGHTNHVLDVAWRSDGTRLASCGADNVIKVWDFETGDRLTDMGGFNRQILALQYIGESPNVLACGGDSTVRMYNTDNGQNFRNFGGASGYVYSCAATADGRLVIAGGYDSVLRVWNGENAQPIVNFAPPEPEAESDEVAAARQ